VELLWKQDWERARRRFEGWWRRRDLVLWVTAPRERPLEELSEPEPPASLEQRWLDPEYRARQAEYELAHTYFGGEAFPYYLPHIGPGNLATFIGSRPSYDAETVWYEPCITDPDAHPALRFDPANPHFQEQMALVERGLSLSRGRFLVALPDLIENVDILASLRGTESLLLDMIERPHFVQRRVQEINDVFFQAFELIHRRVRDAWGGSCFVFSLWGPGRTAKVQCDACACFSPEMFARFVAPALGEQCRWLDHSLFHLDGTQCIVHLEGLLAIEGLDAVEFTPQAGKPQGGDPAWYDLYRRIRAGGKSVQAVEVKPREVIPLIEAVGPEGLYVMTRAESEAEARALEERVEACRPSA
jgi:hypothetical protein